MPACSLSNIGLHIARRIHDPKYSSHFNSFKRVGHPKKEAIYGFAPKVLTFESLARLFDIKDKFSILDEPPLEIEKTSQILGIFLKKTLVEPQIFQDEKEKTIFDILVNHQFILEHNGSETADQIQQQVWYQFNPLEFIEKIVFEPTLDCNLTCKHCATGYARELIMEPIPLKEIEKALIAALDANIIDRVFQISGGEPTLYQGNLFSLIEFAANAGIKVALNTNAWWGDQTNFTIWGRKFSSASEFAQMLKEIGLNSVMFSLDGTEKIHDQFRNHSGQSNSVLKALESTIKPRLSFGFGTVNHPGLKNPKKFIDNFFSILGFPKSITRPPAFQMVRIGNASANYPLEKDTLNEDDFIQTCKGFYRPDSLRIGADGSVRTCNFAYGVNMLGNLKERSLTEILNSFQETAVYKMHASRNPSPYLDLLNPEIFKGPRNNPCQIWIPLSMIVAQIDNQQKLLGKKLADDEILAIQKQVAWQTRLGENSL
jgi:MoaA/NifB/PqqE/SkfB family radical SAM enzyme